MHNIHGFCTRPLQIDPRVEVRSVVLVSKDSIAHLPRPG